MTQPKQPNSQTSWVVISQTPGLGKLPSGMFGQGINIVFTLENGTSGSVFVPNEDYTPEKVRQAIHDRASIMHSVSNLSGKVG